MWYFSTSNPALRDKCQLLQGSCSLVAPCPSCSCLHLLPEQLPVQQKDWRYLEVFEGNISNTSNHLTWSHLHFLCNSLIGLITRLCRLHYKMTCTCHKLPPARQHPWFGSKNALFIHKVVRDWPVWKHLTFIPGWSKVGNGWHTMGQATSPGVVPSPSGFSRILCSLWASGRLGRPPREKNQAENMMCKNLSRHHKISRDLMWESFITKGSKTNRSANDQSISHRLRP